MVKNIVHVIIGLNVGGAELMLKRLVLHSQAKGEFKHEVISLTDLGVIGQQLEAQGISVYTLGMTSALSLPVIYFRLRKLLRKIKPDVVQTWMYHADFIGGLAAKNIGTKKIIWGIRTTDVTLGASKLTVFLRSICAKLSYTVPTNIVCAAHISRDVHISVGYDPKKMVVIPNGFELNKLQATELDRTALRKELMISDDEIVIGSVGRFNQIKNQQLFVDVAALLAKTNPKLKFMLVGRDNTTGNKELMGWIKNYNLSDKFLLLGQRSDVPICLKAMDIFCLHSKTEGFPNVLGEAVLLGKSVISTNVGDVKYLIPPDFVVDSTASSLSEKINMLINSKDYLNFKKLNTKCIEFSEKYNLKKCVLKYENLYLDE